MSGIRQIAAAILIDCNTHSTGVKNRVKIMLVQPFVKFRELTSQVFEFPKYSPVSVPRLIQFDPLNSANEWREI